MKMGARGSQEQKGTFPSTPTHLGRGRQHLLAASAPEQDHAWDPDLRSGGQGDCSGGRGLSRLVLVRALGSFTFFPGFGGVPQLGEECSPSINRILGALVGNGLLSTSLNTLV